MKTPFYVLTPVELKRHENTLQAIPLCSEHEVRHPLAEENRLLADEAMALNEEEAWWRGTPRRIPVNRVDSIFLLQDGRLNTQLLQFLTKHNIVLHVFNYYGYYAGSYMPRTRMPNGRILQAQVEVQADPARRFYLSRELVKGAAANLQRTLAYYRRKDERLEPVLRDFERKKELVDETKSVEELLGVEGNLRKTFYQGFDQCVEEAFRIRRRSYHPPNNPANALISFFNGLLYATVIGELYKTQLHPTVGIYHRPGRHQYPLAYDLAEIFRPLLTERLALSIIRRGIADDTDFEESLQGCYLKPDARAKMSRAFESRLRTTVKHRMLNRSVSYRYLIRLEAYKLIKDLIEEKPYEAFTLWW